MDKAYKTWCLFLDRVIGYTAAVVMLAVTVLAVVEIFRRYLLGRTFYWGQDAETYLLIGAIFLFFGATQARRDHLAVTAFGDWLRARKNTRIVIVLRMMTTLFSLFVVWGFVYWGLPAADRTRMLGRMTESMIIPLWPFQYALLLGFALMGITMLFQLYGDLQAFRGKVVYPSDTSEEGLHL